MKINIIKEFEKSCDDTVETADFLTKQNTKYLDNCVYEVRKLLGNGNDLTIEQLNHYITLIPVLIYSVYDNIQSVGIKSDAAKMQRKQVYNTAYLRQTNGTVAKKTSIAQSACEDEQFIEDIFNRVYKQCELRIDTAMMIHGSLKKILQWRISELEVTRTNTINGLEVRNGK